MGKSIFSELEKLRADFSLLGRPDNIPDLFYDKGKTSVKVCFKYLNDLMHYGQGYQYSGDTLSLVFEKAINKDFTKAMEVIADNMSLKDIYSYSLVLLSFCRSRIAYIKKIKNVLLKAFLIHDFIYLNSLDLSGLDYIALSGAAIDIYFEDAALFFETINRVGRHKYCGEFFISLFLAIESKEPYDAIAKEIFANLPYEIDISYSFDNKDSIDKFCAEISGKKTVSYFEIGASVIYDQYKKHLENLKQREYGRMSISIYINVLLNGLVNYYNANKEQFICDLDALIFEYESWSQKWHTNYSSYNKDYFVLMNQFYMLSNVNQNVDLLCDVKHTEQKEAIKSIQVAQFRYELFWRHLKISLNAAQCLTFNFK